MQDLMNKASVFLTRDELIWSMKHVNDWDKLEKIETDDIIMSSDIVRINFPHIEAELSADFSYENPNEE